MLLQKPALHHKVLATKHKTVTQILFAYNLILGKLFGRKGRARCVVRAAVDAVFAVVAAVVREQHLQERHAAAVGRKRVAAARDGRGRAADLALLIAALGPARGAGGVVLCRVGKDRELVEKVHVLSGRISLCGAWAGRAGAACSSPWW